MAYSRMVVTGNSFKLLFDRFSVSKVRLQLFISPTNDMELFFASSLFCGFKHKLMSMTKFQKQQLLTNIIG